MPEYTPHQPSEPQPRDLSPTRPYTPPFETTYEMAYRQRVDELLTMEQAVLAARTHGVLPAHQPQHPIVVAHQPAPPLPSQNQQVPTAAKTYAVVALSTGSSLALGGIGLAAAAPALASLATLAVSAAGVVIAIVVALLLARATNRPSAGTEVHVHRGARVRVRSLHIR